MKKIKLKYEAPALELTLVDNDIMLLESWEDDTEILLPDLGDET